LYYFTSVTEDTER